MLRRRRSVAELQSSLDSLPSDARRCDDAMVAASSRRGEIILLRTLQELIEHLARGMSSPATLVRRARQAYLRFHAARGPLLLACSWLPAAIGFRSSSPTGKRRTELSSRRSA